MDSDATTPEIDVEIGDNQKHLEVDPEAFTGLVRRVLAAEGVTRASLSIVLVDDATIHEINRRHLGHDWPTDVITFPLSDPDDPVLSGELIISTEMAASTARQASADPQAELALYLVHGLLHLCGYDDQSADDRVEIRRREGEILAGEGLTNTFPLVGLAEGSDAGRESTRWAV